MQVSGGYIIGGADTHGAPTGQMNDVDPRRFDEANLVPALLRYLSPPLELRTRLALRDHQTLVVIYVGPHPSGCAFFCGDGSYRKNGHEKVVFRAGDVFWRDGTRSVRVTQQGLEAIIERRVADSKAGWLEEHRELNQRERAEVEQAYDRHRLAEAPLGAVNLDLDSGSLDLAVLELIRHSDAIGVRYLLNDALIRARALIGRDEIEGELGEVLDKLACLAATFLSYAENCWFEQVLQTITEIYSMPLREMDAQRFGFSTQIAPHETAPRVWLLVLERVYALGALAVRRRDWAAVRMLTVQHPERLTDYDANWLRHALTMVSRAQHLETQNDGQTVHLSLLSLARNVVANLACLRPDGIEADDDLILTSLAQFDALSNLVAIDDAGDSDTRVFYTNFARFRQDRIQPAVERLLTDQGMRQAIFGRGDDELAVALRMIGDRARSEGSRYDGFHGWGCTPVGNFIAARTPDTG